MTETNVLRGGTLKAGDTKPSLRVKLTEDGDAFNLTDYDVTMLAKLANGDTLTVNASATVESPTRGIVVYEWSAGETDEPGTYEVEFVADDGTDEITFPNRGTEVIYMEERLG